MKVKDLNGKWKAINVYGRVIIKSDLKVMAKDQVEALNSMEVFPTDTKGRYKAL